MKGPIRKSSFVNAFNTHEIRNSNNDHSTTWSPHIHSTAVSQFLSDVSGAGTKISPLAKTTDMNQNEKWFEMPKSLDEAEINQVVLEETKLDFSKPPMLDNTLDMMSYKVEKGKQVLSNPIRAKRIIEELKEANSPKPKSSSLNFNKSVTKHDQSEKSIKLSKDSAIEPRSNKNQLKPIANPSEENKSKNLSPRRSRDRSPSFIQPPSLPTKLKSSPISQKTFSTIGSTTKTSFNLKSPSKNGTFNLKSPGIKTKSPTHASPLTCNTAQTQSPHKLLSPARSSNQKRTGSPTTPSSVKKAPKTPVTVKKAPKSQAVVKCPGSTKVTRRDMNSPKTKSMIVLKEGNTSTKIEPPKAFVKSSQERDHPPSRIPVLISLYRRKLKKEREMKQKNLTSADSSTQKN